MRKYIIYILVTFLVSLNVAAQTVIATTLTVDIKTEEGKDSTIVIQKTPIYGSSSDSFRFWGGEGTVTNPITKVVTQEKNKDIYGWTENLDYNSVTVKALPSVDAIDRLGYQKENFGYCISKQPNPVVSESIILASSYYYWQSQYYEGWAFSIYTFDLSNYNDPNTSYTISPWNLRQTNTYFAKLEGLEYMTTYYVRPYIKLNENYIMYGGEISFTTPRTMEGALRNEEDLQDRNYCNWSTGVVLKSKALQTLLGDKFEFNDNMYRGISKELERYLTSDMLLQLQKQAYKEIECTDGTLYLVEDIPTDIVESFQKHLNSEIIFSPMGNVINSDMLIAGSGEKVTKNLYYYESFECNPAWNVPNNSYVYFQNSGTQNPSIGINIPQCLLPQAYDIYVVLVSPDLENDPRRYRFYTYIWEQQDAMGYPNAGTRMSLEDGTVIFESDSVLCDTIYLGRYTFNGNPETIIQFVTNISSSNRSQFNYCMSISQIKLVPVNE